MNKKEIKFILTKVLILIIVGAIILYLGRNKNVIIEENEKELANKFSENREILWVKSDSLVQYLDKLQIKQPNVFELEESDSQLILRALDQKPFNTLFLDGEYLSRYDKNEHLGISKIEDGYGFSLKIEEKTDTRFVKIPAEVMQSILINN